MHAAQAEALGARGTSARRPSVRYELLQHCSRPACAVVRARPSVLSPPPLARGRRRSPCFTVPLRRCARTARLDAPPAARLLRCSFSAAAAAAAAKPCCCASAPVAAASAAAAGSRAPRLAARQPPCWMRRPRQPQRLRLSCCSGSTRVCRCAAATALLRALCGLARGCCGTACCGGGFAVVVSLASSGGSGGCWPGGR